MRRSAPPRCKCKLPIEAAKMACLREADSREKCCGLVMGCVSLMERDGVLGFEANRVPKRRVLIV
jgi:hypothetical protein